MKREKDAIVFESKREIESIMFALQEFLSSDEGTDYIVDQAEQLNELLESMHMTW